MSRFLSLLLSLILAMAANAVHAATPDPDVKAIRAGPVTVRADRAYILFRNNRVKAGLYSFEQVFLRTPGAEEIAAYHAAKRAAFEKDLPSLTKQAAAVGATPDYEDYGFVYKGRGNLFAVKASDFIDDAGSERVFLIEVPPGEYVLYGIKTGGFRSLQNCNCFGTAKFQAAAGVVTDLGSVLTGLVGPTSPIPELTQEPAVDGTDGWAMGQAVRPPTDAAYLPPVLAAVPRQPAELHAVGPYVERGVWFVGRLAPVAGVLRYEGFDVIDVRTGKRAD